MDGVFSGYWLEAVASFLVWLLANGVYLDMTRSGRRGLRRLVAFWFGTPTTWLTLLFVSEGTRVPVETPPDDEEALLEEIRRDRRLRSAARSEPGSADDPPGEEPPP